MTKILTIEEANGENRLSNGIKRTNAVLAARLTHDRRSIYLWRDVVRVLGAPKYVSIRVNQEYDSFAVTPGEANGYMSFLVPDGLSSAKQPAVGIHSSRFCEELIAMNDLTVGESYRIEGHYSEKNNAVIFNVADAVVIPKKKSS
ncbi:MAG: hypothetical protein PHI98_16915 [Eubacteriales bacterium]|nr:hypothetical protein [Eubacteriales bacterium]